MDLTTITEVVRRPSERPGTDWREGDAWLAGGTWLYSTEQPGLRRLIDLTALRWEPLVTTDEGLEIGATCTVQHLYAHPWPRRWTAGILFRKSCEAFLSSFKVWNAATVGGNICMSLPAGPMITLTVALEARYELWAPDGSVRCVDALDFVTGDHRNVLGPGEILRRVTVPERALRKRTAHRRFTLTRLGRSTVFLVGTQRPGANDLLLTVTAGTTRPVRFAFDSLPDARTLRQSIDAVPAGLWFADPNGTPDHRRHLTRYFAEEIRRELTAGDLA
ncbi:FAD binding domain-containing protein [Streptomyces sp. NPDC059688]|uniref:FAD binding domain-containing protein n=2 Tax=Streptomyces TaxID=1883 RepID=A0ABV1UAT3_9ACTN|nr:MULTISPECIES: FAD binding domain-containing protein [unclassified Streptomyces]OKJ84718.1 FAD-binding molybdopterin dehydrogenase [Streptomyces sp. CB01883]ROP46911.1 CO/xanthine dehydrogenase FAD-binding subunit [Streptomyces sp. PanSC9]UXY38960.1 FAD binding domain-containing protein [Streptomyces sp. HUAS 14-6]